MWHVARRQFVNLLSLLILVFLGVGTASAQTTGSIEGRVVDVSGAALPGASIEATSPNLQGIRQATSSHDGTFRIPAVPPGGYSIRASLPGFRTAEKTATVPLDGTANVALSLEPAVSEGVIVTGEAPLIDVTSTTTGTNYTSQITARLPVDRNYADVVRLNPGVSTDRGTTEGRSLALTVYGATSAENQWIIDGVNTTNVFKGVQGKAINSEFVQEVEVKTGGYQAEYGRALGGVINVITKSGGNEFHGDAFVYYDSSETVAQQEFGPGDSGITAMDLVEGERFDFGVDMGGFLVRDRLWFFGAYNRVAVESQVSRAEASTYVSPDDRFPIDATTNLYSGKLTWNIGSSTSAVATVFADPSTSSGAAGADPHQGLGANETLPPVSLDPSTWYSERFQGATDFGLRATHLFGSSAVATVQGSYHADRNELTPPDGVRTIDETCEGGTPEEPCDFPAEANSITGGYGNVFGPSDHSESSRSQFGGVVTFYSSKHEIKAGGDYQDGETNALNLLTGGQVVRARNEFGQLYYAHRFYAVSPDDLTVAPGYWLRAEVRDVGAFVQDSWRPSAGLTVNAGLRWDAEEVHDYAGRTVLSFDDEWQPRLGVVWDPWKDGATKIYASAGRFSYALPTVAAAIVFSSATQIETYNFDPVGRTQDPGVIGYEESFVRFSGEFGNPVDPNARGWYQDELIVGVERLVGPTLTLGLKGTYRTLQSVLEDRCDLDYTSEETGFSSCGLANLGSGEPIASGQVPTCNGLDGDLYECGIDPGPATPSVSRIYQGIELLARKSFGDDLWMQASYVYSSLRGNYDGAVNQGAYGQTWPGINADFDYPQMVPNSDGRLALDRPHRFRFDGYWVAPWRLSIGLEAFVESGAPLNRLGYMNQWYGPVINLVPRGSEGRLPTLWEANLTLGYPFQVGAATVTVQAYLFNIFNNQIAIASDEQWSTNQPENYPDSIFDPNQEQSNTEYGKVTARYDPRMFRAALKVSF